MYEHTYFPSRQWNPQIALHICPHSYTWFNKLHYNNNLAMHIFGSAVPMHSLALNTKSHQSDTQEQCRHNMTCTPDTPVTRLTHLWHGWLCPMTWMEYICDTCSLHMLQGRQWAVAALVGAKIYIHTYIEEWRAWLLEGSYYTMDRAR